MMQRGRTRQLESHVPPRQTTEDVVSAAVIIYKLSRLEASFSLTSIKPAIISSRRDRSEQINMAARQWDFAAKSQSWENYSSVCSSQQINKQDIRRNSVLCRAK